VFVLLCVKGKQSSHASQSSLRYPKLILERLCFFPLALTQTLQVLASSCLPQQILNFSSNLLALMKQPKNSLQLPKTARNT